MRNGEISRSTRHATFGFLHQAGLTPQLWLILPNSLAATSPIAAAWRIRAGRQLARAQFLACRLQVFDPAHLTFLRLGQLLGLSPREQSLLAGLIRHGELRSAAEQNGIAYESARKVLKSVMAKGGFARQTELVSQAIRLDALEAPSAIDQPEVLFDTFGLTPRQCQLVQCLTGGQTRQEAARSLGLSLDLTKLELKRIFSALGIGSTTVLAAVVAQVNLAAQALRLPNLLHPSISVAAEPVRLLRRSERGGRIAFTDYGPRGRMPTIHFHTATTSRYYPRSYVARLQAGGLRPVMLDRPGYGLTDIIEGDIVAQSALDVLELADALGAERFNLIARGGTAQFSWLAKHHRDRINLAVVLNPEPPPDGNRAREGLLGRMKRLFYQSPRAAQAFARFIANNASDATIERLASKVFDRSPADRRLFSDPAIRQAYVHASRLAAVQDGIGMARAGFAEPLAAIEPLSEAEFITIICGQENGPYNAQDSLPRLQRAWPSARVVLLEGAGHLLHLQHPELIARTLNKAG